MVTGAEAVAGALAVSRAVATLAQDAASCPGCIEMSSPNWMSGMIWGMLLFMIMPFAVVFGIGGGLLRANRRQREVDPNGGGP
ncbi:MAG: hypothetical protein ACR2GQ_04315 [Gemmatimonadota bacterium]